MNSSPLKVLLEKEGRLLHLTLARPKANIVDFAMLAALKEAMDEHKTSNQLMAVLIDAEGPNFSYGASVEDHLPDQCADMLKSINGLILEMIDFPLPVIAAVRGYCLGGGMEITSACSNIFAAPDAIFGQPEIQLAVFAPVASCLLPELIGRAAAEDLLFSGRNIDVNEALRIGLINSIHDDPVKAAIDYFEKHLLPHSTFTMRHAVWAAKVDYVDRIRDKLARVEKRYMDDLMSGEDPKEGLHAFIEKRQPLWKNS